MLWENPSPLLSRVANYTIGPEKRLCTVLRLNSTRFDQKLSISLKLLDLRQKKNMPSPAGNRTPVSRVTGGDTHHYTTEDAANISIRGHSESWWLWLKPVFHQATVSFLTDRYLTWLLARSAMSIELQFCRGSII